MVAGVVIANNLITVLEKRKLGHLLENFQREKVTVDVISKLSARETECLDEFKVRVSQLWQQSTTKADRNTSLWCTRIQNFQVSFRGLPG